MKSIILFLHVLILAGCSNYSEETKLNGITSKENNSKISKNQQICNCFFGNEEEYEFIFPDECEIQDSLLILIPDTTSFHETGFQNKMFNLYNDVLSFLMEQKFSGRTLAYYDKDQKHLALELNMLNGEMDGVMKAYSFEGEIDIERYFENDSLISVKNDIGNIDWFYSKERNELQMDPSYLQNGKTSLLFSSDVKHQPIIDWGIKPEEVFNKTKPLKVNSKVYSGIILYYGDKEGFTPLPIVKLSFSNGFLDGKTTFYGDYEDYPRYFDAWVIKEEIYYSNGVRSKASNSLDNYVLYQGAAFMKIDEEKVLNEFKLSFDVRNNSVQDAGRFELTQGFPRQYYITGGERRGDTLEIEMVGVSDARMSTIENAIANGERNKIPFLISGLSLRYIGNSEGCDYCSSGLTLNKYDPAESEFVRFLKPN